MSLEIINKLLTSDEYKTQEEVNNDLELVKASMLDSLIKTKTVIEFCEPHLEMMWSARICSILLGCGFKDTKDYIKDFYECCKENGI